MDDATFKVMKKIGGINHKIDVMSRELIKNRKNWINLNKDANWWTDSIVSLQTRTRSLEKRTRKIEKDVKYLGWMSSLFMASVCAYEWADIKHDNEVDKRLKAVEEELEALKMANENPNFSKSFEESKIVDF